MKRLLLLCLLACNHLAAQPLSATYNTDSLLQGLSANAKIKNILHKASVVYRSARIQPDNVSLTAFKVAFLEKTFIDEGLVQVRLPQTQDTLPYRKSNLLSVIDFTKAGNRKRFITVDLRRKILLRSALVSHGSATGAGIEEIRRQYGLTDINDKYKAPLFFGNAIDSWRSSLGMMLTLYDTLPANPCHLCKDYAEHPHNCVVVLEGLEQGINDNVRVRDIVMHTTGSRDYSHKLPLIAKAYNIDKDSLRYRENKSCNCYRDGQHISSDYASACGIKENKGYIGRGNGCLVLPEEQHKAILETVKEGSLIFTYSNATPATGTPYFEASPIIRQIVAYVREHEDMPQGAISFELTEQTVLSTEDTGCNKLFGGISAIEEMPETVLDMNARKEKNGLFLFSDHHKGTGQSNAFRYKEGTVFCKDYFYDLKDIESVRYNKYFNQLYYSFERDTETGVGFIDPDAPQSGGLLVREQIPSANTSGNRGIEGITFDQDNRLWVAFESGGDTSCSQPFIPFYCYVPGKAMAGRKEHPYAGNAKSIYEYPFARCNCLAPDQAFNGWTGNGVSEILAFKDDKSKLLVLERCFDGKKADVKLYLATIKAGSRRLDKELVFDFNNNASFADKDKDFTPDNLEGMCWHEENGVTFLYLVSDNNFSRKQRNQMVKLRLIRK